MQVMGLANKHSYFNKLSQSSWANLLNLYFRGLLFFDTRLQVNLLRRGTDRFAHKITWIGRPLAQRDR